MTRLSKELTELQGHYDAVVVGSGYGGSIAACRLARAGQRVAVFERGRELHPGEFPTTLVGAERHFQVSGLTESGDPRNLYWLHADERMSVFSGCGLGGTSLVNANVSIRPDPRVFEDPAWPRALREDTGGLDAAYKRAEEMLGATTYPASFPPLAKTDALRTLAGEEACYLTPINVTFRPGPNAAGVHQEACTGCGDCVSGCNVGAKNTLLMNYLPDAVAHGADLFTEMDARWVDRNGEGADWTVHIQPLGLGRERFGGEPTAVTAPVVVLAAGTLGTARILFRSRQQGLAVSDRLGHRFTGNGDVLAFAYRPGRDVRAVGSGRGRPDPDAPTGPCITAVVDRRQGRPVDDGVIVEDAVVPGAVASLLSVELLGQEVPGWIHGRLGAHGPFDALRSLVTRARRGFTAHLQTLLVMGNDDGRGTLVAHGDDLRVDWPDVGRSAYYERANQVVQDATEDAGGTFLHNPVWSKLLHKDLVTVHPLGGCTMAERAEDGVVDDRGRVFAGPVGDAVHEGLMVWDGSIVPRPLGVNPLLTISALAERAAAALADEHGWAVDDQPASRVATPPEAAPQPPRRPGLHFTERMVGHWSPDRRDDAGDLAAYEIAARAGGADRRTMAFELTMTTDDLRATVGDLARPMTAVGTVAIGGLSDQPLLVEGGSFQLLAPDDELDDTVRHMWYRLPLRTVDGRRLHFAGFKVVAPGALDEVWPATTTLYVTLRRDGPDGPVEGRGVLRIRPADFARQLRTFQVSGPAHELERLRLEAAFGRAFAGALYEHYGSVVDRTMPFRSGAPPRRRRSLDLPRPQEVSYPTADGVPLRLTRYRGGDKGPVLLAHGMGANPGTLLLDTVHTNLTEYLVAHGYDVWVQEWRASTLLPSALTQFTADTVAAMDHPAAAAAVQAETGRSDLHVVAHCVGSITWVMAVLSGSVHPASILCSSVATHPVGPTITRLKVGLRLGELLKRSGVGFLTSDAFTGESPGARLVDRLLRAYPVPREERCHEAVCRRLAFIYGIAAHHANLNEPTHVTMHELFGPTNMTMMDHLSVMARHQQLVAADGTDRYLPHLDRLAMPVTLVSGERNLVWVPRSTELSEEALTAAGGGGSVRRVVLPDYGHQDVFIGARAAADAYPVMLDHLHRANA